MSALAEQHRALTALLGAHGAALATKGIGDVPALRAAICADLARLRQGARLLATHEGERILGEICAGQPALSDLLRAYVAKAQLDHVGFEVCEPLDLIEAGLRPWTGPGEPPPGPWRALRVQRVLRFPASRAYMARAACAIEIMRLWVEWEGQPLLLELFDAHRPPRLRRGGRTAGPSAAGAGDPFDGDAVFHYAFALPDADDVRALHGELLALSRRGAGFTVPFKEAVENDGDGSVYTRLIHRSSRLELELVAQRPPALAPAASAPDGARPPSPLGERPPPPPRLP